MEAIVTWMSSIAYSVFVVCTVGLVGIVSFGLIQNARLSRYRERRLTEIYRAVQHDATVGRDSHWRYVMFNAPSDEAMLWKVWRSFDSFYPDRSFLDPDAVDPGVDALAPAARSSPSRPTNDGPYDWQVRRPAS